MMNKQSVYKDVVFKSKVDRDISSFNMTIDYKVNQNVDEQDIKNQILAEKIIS